MSSRAEISIYGSCALEILPLPGRTKQQCKGYSLGGKGGMNSFTTNPTCAARLKVPIWASGSWRDPGFLQPDFPQYTGMLSTFGLIQAEISTACREDVGMKVCEAVSFLVLIV